MARYVLLRIEDNDEAEAFVKGVEQQDVFFMHSNTGTSTTVETNSGTGSYGYLVAKVLGLFGAPTQFCECGDKSEVSARSKKYGWWVHRKCAKPKPGNMQHPHNLLGRNELGKHKPELYIGVTEPRKETK